MNAYERHVRELAHALGAHITYEARHGWCDGYDGGAWGNPPRIRVVAATWNRAAHYVALHELGHLACKHHDEDGGLTRYRQNVLQYEAEAWLWALDHALEHPEPAEIDMFLGPHVFGYYAQTYFTPDAPAAVEFCARLGVPLTDLIERR